MWIKVYLKKVEYSFNPFGNSENKRAWMVVSMCPCGAQTDKQSTMTERLIWRGEYNCKKINALSKNNKDV